MALAVLDVLGKQDAITIAEAHRDPYANGGVAHRWIIPTRPGQVDTNSCSLYRGHVGTSVWANDR